MVMNTFKIACLSYTPTPLMYRNKVFNRENLILLRGKMLANCWNECYNLLPFKKGMDIEDDAAEKMFNLAILQQSFLKSNKKMAIERKESMGLSMTSIDPPLKAVISEGIQQSRNKNFLNEKTNTLLKLSENRLTLSPVT
jgi:hypothetical protein